MNLEKYDETEVVKAQFLFSIFPNFYNAYFSVRLADPSPGNRDDRGRGFSTPFFIG